MKPEQDPPRCPDCGEKVLNQDFGTITPHGVFHEDCKIPDPEDSV